MWSDEDKAQWILENANGENTIYVSYIEMYGTYYRKFYRGYPWQTEMDWHEIEKETIPQNAIIHCCTDWSQVI